MTELKPCPFCGSEAWVAVKESQIPGIAAVGVTCSHCASTGGRVPAYAKADGDVNKAMIEAIARWNRRHGEQ